jgi:molecular chaperone DnaK
VPFLSFCRCPNSYVDVCIVSLIHNIQKNLTEHGEKIDAATKSEIEATIESAKGLGDDATNDEMKEKITALTNASMKIGQAMYGNKTGGDADAAPAEGAKEGGAKEAEYEEKK